MKGEQGEDGTYDGYISRILAKCGMAPKFIVIAGGTKAGEEEQISGAFLGVGYLCKTDEISFKFPPSFKRKERGGPRLRSRCRTRSCPA